PSAMSLEEWIVSMRQLLTAQPVDVASVCNQVNASLELLTGQPIEQLNTALETFDVQHHSAAVLCIIRAKLHIAQLPQPAVDTLVEQTRQFLSSFNGEQIRLLPVPFNDLCHRFVKLLVSRQDALVGVGPMLRAVLTVQRHDAELTGIHCDLCELCLTAKCLKPALQVLDVDINDVRSTVDCREYLLYYYYGGMIYLGLKHYDRAFLMLENAISLQASLVSSIMLEAYKKWLLVGLLCVGRKPQPPKFTSTNQIVRMQYVGNCQAYMELVDAFDKKSPSELRDLANRHESQYRADRNWGLVKQVLTSRIKQNILHLTKTFITLSLSDLASRAAAASPAEAELYLLELIEEKKIFASIDQARQVVTFRDNPEQYASADMLDCVESETKQVMTIDRVLGQMLDKIRTSHAYAAKVAAREGQQQRSGGGGGGGGGGGMIGSMY
ncbi:hypothetical protein BOX15_Mlig028374g9, partial [Macrostomum lignano]